VTVTKRASCYTSRHVFATQLLEGGYNIRTIQELLGHKDIKTAMIYANVLNCCPPGSLGKKIEYSLNVK
jgi:site-specific recombinase XerD